MSNRPYKYPPHCGVLASKCQCKVSALLSAICVAFSLVNIQAAQAKVYVENDILVIRELDWQNKEPTK